MRTVHVLPNMVAYMILCTIQILHQSLIVMGSCVYHRVRCIVVWKIFVVAAATKGKLQYFHARVTGFCHQITNSLCHVAKILRNDLNVFHMFFHFFKKRDTRSLFPLSDAGVCHAVRNGVILIKTTEMINSNHIIQYFAMFDTTDPPCKVLFFMVFPVIDWVAPELPIGGKSVWRASSNFDWVHIFVKLK